MKWIASLVLMAASTLGAAEEPLRVNALYADYENNELLLSGEVFIEHCFGSITSDQAIAPYEPGKKSSKLILEDHVLITLKNGGSLKCGHAELNADTMLGLFRSNPTCKSVHYHGLTGSSEGKLLPLDLRSAWMQLQLAKLYGQQVVDRVDAHGNVVIRYDNEIVAYADEASYQRQISRENPSSFPGTVTLLPWPGRSCKVLHAQRNRIAAQEIRIDTITRQLHFREASGEFYLVEEAVPRERVHFSADEITWWELDNHLLLTGNVRLKQREMGKVKTEGTVSILLEDGAGRRNVKELIARGGTTIHYRDPQTGDRHEVVCPGPARILHREQTITLQGAGPNEQIEYHDRVGDLFADRATLHYRENRGKAQLQKLELEGQIRMRTRVSLDGDSDEPVEQYALADSAVFLPQRQTLTLTAKDHKRVLYFDKSRNLRMSAPGILVKRDGSSGKRSYEGIGNVRFTFARHEAALMNELLHFDRSVAEADAVTAQGVR